MQGVRGVLFRVMAVLLPLAAIVGIELIWQMVAPERLFVAMRGQPDYRIVNPNFAARYFRGFKPHVAFNPVLKEKPPNSLRIVALGGSSTAGYPYHFYHAFPERLAAGLRAQYPLKTIEVVNLGMTAINSNVIRDITPAVARLDPDAVLIYAGHNEYYGALGAGTGPSGLRERAALKRAALLLKRSRIYRALERLLTVERQSDRTMMARSVGDADIALQGPAYQAGLRQFEANMTGILRHLRARDIPVYMGTVVSNLEGQPPLGEDSPAASAFQAALELMAAGDSAAALDTFVQARELDPVRFRAPAAINLSIRELAARWDACLVDLEPLFAEFGHDTLFTDHLHPTYVGHQVMAEAFRWAMRDQLPDAEPAPAMDARPDLFEQAHAGLQIRRLKGGFPFTRDLTPEQEWDRFADHLEQALHSGSYPDSLAAAFVEIDVELPRALLLASRRAQDEGDSLQALRFVRALLYWQPFNASVKRSAASLAGRADRYAALAGEVAQLAAARSPDTDLLNTLAAIRLRQRQLNVAEQLLSEVEAQAPESPFMLYNTARLLVLQGDTLTARDYFVRYQAAVAQGSP